MGQQQFSTIFALTPYDMSSPNYPPSTTNPLDTATPQRTTRLNTRGTSLNGIQQVMAQLQELYPRRIFPDDGNIDEARTPVPDPLGWRRGGTSPSGASLGGSPGGSYFVGYPEQFIGSAAPQRIVWEPPGVGEEEYVPSITVGPYVDAATQPLPSLLTAQGPLSDEHYRQMGQYAAAPFLLRLIPWRVHIWGNDWDDEDELIHWFLSSAQVVLNGSIPNQYPVRPGGYVPDEKGTRGLHYVCSVVFAAPIHYPYFGERVMVGAALRRSGAAPFSVVAEEG